MESPFLLVLWNSRFYCQQDVTEMLPPGLYPFTAEEDAIVASWVAGTFVMCSRNGRRSKDRETERDSRTKHMQET